MSDLEHGIVGYNILFGNTGIL